MSRIDIGGLVPSAPDGTDQVLVRRGLTNQQVALVPFSAPVSVKMFGAVGDGVTDDTLAIQAASDYCAANKVKLFFPNGTYKLTQQTTRGGRGYALMMKANSYWEGEAPGQVTLKFTRQATTCDVVISEARGTFPNDLPDKNLGIRNIVIDGNADAAGSNGFSLWWQKVEYFTLENFVSINSTNWGARIEQSQRGVINGYTAQHLADVNADGLHFVDCRHITGDQFDIYSEGDDGFIIETLSHDVWNMSFTNVNVRCPTAGIAGGRGILLLHESVTTPTAPRRMENITIQGTAKDCYGSAFEIGGAPIMRNCSFDIQAENCRSLYYLQVGNASFAGFVSECSFRGRGNNLTEHGVLITTTGPGLPFFGAQIDDNTIDVAIRNPANNSIGARIIGSRWHGSVQVDYNPNADKTLFGPGLDVYARESVLTVSAIGATTGLLVRDVSRRCTFIVGDVNGLEAQTGSVPMILGNRVSGTVTGTFRGRMTDTLFEMNLPLTGTAVTQSQVDATSGRLVKVGDYGIGTTNAPLLADVDDASILGGVFYAYNTATTVGTFPAGAASTGYVLAQRFDGGTVMQTLHEGALACRQWRRRRTAGSWLAWQGPF